MEDRLKSEKNYVGRGLKSSFQLNNIIRQLVRNEKNANRVKNIVKNTIGNGNNTVKNTNYDKNHSVGGEVLNSSKNESKNEIKQIEKAFKNVNAKPISKKIKRSERVRFKIEPKHIGYGREEQNEDSVYVNYNGYCAPHIKYDGVSCFSTESLRDIAAAIYVSTKNVEYSNERIANLSKKQLHELISKHMNGAHESDWLSNPIVKSTHNQEVLKYSLRPKYPEEWIDCKENEAPNRNCRYTWLHTFNIQDVMLQYERKFPDFRFMGAVPIDFQDVSPAFKKFDITEWARRDIRHIGIIFNTDPSYEDGEHWICMYIHIGSKTLTINFFDSYGHTSAVPLEIKSFIKKMEKQWTEQGKRYNTVVEIAKTRHQYDNSECGMYCLYFIIQRLHGTSFRKLERHRIDDDTMNRFRRLLYS